MKKKNLIIIGAFLLIIPLVFAAPPSFQTVDTLTGLEIETTPYQYIKIHEDFTAHFHVFNKSNGVFLTNDTTDCFLHIYNSTGNHLFKSNELDFELPFDFELMINGTNFSKIQQYAYIIQCNTTGGGGFKASTFEVTKDGFELQPHIGLYVSLTLIFIFLITVGLIFYFWRGEGEHD